MIDYTPVLTSHFHDILRDSLKHEAQTRAILVFDEHTELAKQMTAAYHANLPNAVLLPFDEAGAEGFFRELDLCQPGDLVVLVQSTNFRLNDFRIRIEIFKRGLKTIEHSHLERMDEQQIAIYVDSLAYNKERYHRLGHGIKALADACQTITVESGGLKLQWQGGMEPAKLNIGDYSGMENVGGTFPIGEVFTEGKTLESLNGEAMLFAFANMDHRVSIYQPFKVTIKDGLIEAGDDAPQTFKDTLDLIRATEPAMVRECGFGLNPAMNKHRFVSDITTFERQTGLHLSLGAKHGVYKKPGLQPQNTRYHIDVFVDVDRILIDDTIIFQNGDYTL